MKLVIGVILIWVGSALLYVSTHDTGASSPWQVYGKVLQAGGGS